MIKTIAYQNLKGSSAKHDLGARTLITGANFAGKSTVLQAILLATNGHIPALGKTNAATFQLASAGTMTVQIAMSVGKTGEAIFARSWKQSGKSIKLVTTGGDLPPLALLSGDAFTAATPKARLAMLAGQAGGDWTPLEKLVGEIAKRHNIKPEGETIIEQAEATQELLKELAAATRTRKDQFEKTLGGLVELAATDPTEPPEDFSKAVFVAAQKLTAANQAVSNHEAAADAAFDAKEALAAMPAEAANEPADPTALRAALSQKDRELTAARQHRQEAMARLKVIEPYLSPVWTEEDEAQRTHDLEAAKISGATLEKVQQDLDGIRELLTTHQTRAKMLREQIALLDEQIGQFQISTACPTCGACQEGWKEKVNATYSQQRDEKEQRLHTENTDLLRVQAHFDRSIELRKVLLRLELSDKQWAAVEAVPAFSTEAASHRETIALSAQTIEAAEAAIKDLEQALREFESHALRHQQWKELTAEASKYEEHSTALETAHAKQSEADAELQRLKEAHAAAEPARVAWAGARSRELDLVTARETADKEAEKLKAIAGDEKALQSTKDEVLRTLYASVVATAQNFSTGVLPTPLDLHPTTGQIGRWNKETFIPYDAMSGAEQLVAIGSLQAALAATGSGILMLDEMSRMRPETKKAFLRKIEEAINAGHIAQAIVVDHNHDGYEIWDKITA